jgi:hypothetical protein
METLRVGGCDLNGHAAGVGRFGVSAESTQQVRAGGSQQVVAGEVIGSDIGVRLRLEAQLPPDTSARTATQSTGARDSGQRPTTDPSPCRTWMSRGAGR